MSMTQPDPDAVGEYWQEAVEQMNEQWSEAIERNLKAQTEFVGAWLEAMGETADDETIEEAVDGYRNAYETWMSAAEGTIERSTDALEGEDVSVEEIRDIWLNAANQSFKEIMTTGAFAAATGQAVGDTLDLRRQSDEMAEATLHQLGFATEGDVSEVGARLVELERRQQAVEDKLDEILDALER